MAKNKTALPPPSPAEPAPPPAPLAKPATPPGNGGLLEVPASWGLQIPIGDYRTHLDETTEEGRRLLFAFLNGDGHQPEDMVNKDIGCVNLSIMPIAKEVNGELLPLPRVAVHHDDGTFTDFRSGGILKSLGFIVKRYGIPPWRPALKLRLERLRIGTTTEGAPKYMYRYNVTEPG